MTPPQLTGHAGTTPSPRRKIVLPPSGDEWTGAAARQTVYVTPGNYLATHTRPETETSSPRHTSHRDAA